MSLDNELYLWQHKEPLGTPADLESAYWKAYTAIVGLLEEIDALKERNLPCIPSIDAVTKLRDAVNL